MTKRWLHEKVFSRLDRCYVHSSTFTENDLAMAAGLKQVWSEGKLQRGVRGILATVAMFVLNRHGIDQSAQTLLAHKMLQGFEAKSDAAFSQ